MFLYRFLQISQFKRSYIPNAPKLAGADRYRRTATAPSDGEAAAWLDTLKLIPDE